MLYVLRNNPTIWQQRPSYFRLSADAAIVRVGCTGAASIHTVLDVRPLRLDRRLLTITAGLAMDFLKLRIFRSGACFTEKTKNSPKPVTTNSVAVFSRCRHDDGAGFVSCSNNWST